jgi:energy-converting hydrogenase Eha subunit G
MEIPPLVETHDGKPTISWRGICATGLVVSALSVAGFLGFHFAFNVLLGSTVDLFPGILLAATIPTGAVLGIQLRTQLRNVASGRQ